MNNKECTDHLGNKFESVHDMCKHYKVPYSTFIKRRGQGLGLEECLSSVRHWSRRNGNEVIDHLGNRFPSVVDMCRHYNIECSTYKYRKKQGLSLEERLTKQVKYNKDKKININNGFKDHLGNNFDSLEEMCDCWKVSVSTFKAKISMGATLEEALCNKWVCTDHLGNNFRSVTDMCKYYGTTFAAYTYRIRLGFNKKEALTFTRRQVAENSHRFGGGRKPTDNEVQDHLGNVYRTQREMCNAYGISTTLFCKRRERGSSLEECLTGLKRDYCTDHLGNKYSTKKEMCEAYGITPPVYTGRLKAGKSKQEALEAGMKRYTDHLGNKFNTLDEMCDYWGVPKTTYASRRSKGLPLEERLTKPVEYTDHLGNKFKTLDKMCGYWGITAYLYRYRRKKGMSLKEALETPYIRKRHIKTAL